MAPKAYFEALECTYRVMLAIIIDYADALTENWPGPLVHRLVDPAPLWGEVHD